jgi:hypothetical protein
MDEFIKHMNSIDRQMYMRPSNAISFKTFLISVKTAKNHPQC